MAEFSYIAIDRNGQRLPGRMSAASRMDAIQLLSAQSVLPLTLTQIRTVPLKTRKVKASRVSAVFSLLADQLETGVPLLRALHVLQQQASDSVLKQTLADITDEVADGSSLASAVGQHPNIFSDLDISIIQAGEEGGFLFEALNRLAAVRARQDEARHKLISATAYPVLLMAVGCVVVTGMLVFFVPKFEPLFENLRQNDRMPWPTEALLLTSELLKTWGVPALFMLLALALLGRVCFPVQRAKAALDYYLLKTAGIGMVLRNFAIARFCRTLGSLLQNGVPMLQSLEIARRATGNTVLSRVIGDAAGNIGEGKSLAAPLANSPHFPKDVIEMLSIAEQSNRLEPVLLKLADKLELRAQQELDLLMKLLEPAMMLVLAIVVGFLVIALLMPVFEGNSLV